jgi:hypothetical protein
MGEGVDGYRGEDFVPTGYYTPEDRDDEGLHLSLEINDPTVVEELSTYPDGPKRQEIALIALRIGILALRQAKGSIDVDLVRNEGERLIKEMETRLKEHHQQVSQNVAGNLKDYFDPESGRFSERVERLVKKDGELEELLRRQIGQNDSELSKTLSAHVGESSDLMNILTPDESRGIVGSLKQTLDGALTSQRESILKEFSLDNGQSALSRLVRELNESHEDVKKEFSLDDESSALSRLVRRVEQAQKRISEEFTLDADTSALARMRKELLDVLEEHKKGSTQFQQEVMASLSAMTARKEESRRSTAHGVEFEMEVYQLISEECGRKGDIATHTGNTTGIIKNCKVGDAVIEMGPESVAAGAKIVVEAKESASYTLAKAREEMETARKNRGADVGLFVFSKRTAPERLDSFSRLGSDLFVVWDPEDASSDVYLSAGVSIAKALSVRAGTRKEAEEADLDSIEAAIRDIEKQTSSFEDINKWTETIKSSSDKILDKARIMKQNLERQMSILDERMEDLKTYLKGE